MTQKDRRLQFDQHELLLLFLLDVLRLLVLLLLDVLKVLFLLLVQLMVMPVGIVPHGLWLITRWH
jgi:hypothetical protein